MKLACSSAASRLATRTFHRRAISSSSVSSSRPRAPSAPPSLLFVNARASDFVSAPIVGTETYPPMLIFFILSSATTHRAHDPPPPGLDRFRITPASPHRAHGVVPPPHTMHSNLATASRAASFPPFTSPRTPRPTCAHFSPHHEHHATTRVRRANVSASTSQSDTHPAHTAHLPSPIFANPSAHRSHLCVARAHDEQWLRYVPRRPDARVTRCRDDAPHHEHHPRGANRRSTSPGSHLSQGTGTIPAHDRHLPSSHPSPPRAMARHLANLSHRLVRLAHAPHRVAFPRASTTTCAVR